MGFFRFRRSVKLFPGVRWNIGKRSSSLSFGVKGAHYTVGTAGSRTTVGIPGTGLSYTDIHSSHARVNTHAKWTEVPPPSQEWLDANKPQINFHFPDRKPDEPQATQNQIKEIQGMGALGSDFDWNSLGHDQAENLLSQMREAKSTYSKKILRRYYREQGASVPNWLVDHVVDHPDEPIPGASEKGSGCAGCLGQIVILLIVLAGIGMCTQSDKESSSAKPTPAPSSTPRATATPTPAPTATLPPFPESRYWPKKVRLLKPVEFSGYVSGGTVRSTVSAGTILPAHLSEDHKSLEVRMNDLSASIPLTDTDFLKRAAARQKRSSE